MGSSSVAFSVRFFVVASCVRSSGGVFSVRAFLGLITVRFFAEPFCCCPTAGGFAVRF